MKLKKLLMSKDTRSKARSMNIVINLDVMMAKRKMRLKELSEQVGVSEQNLSILKNGKAKAIRFSTLEKICEVLECQPGDIIVYQTT
jgi:putative transcriptional regulator